MFTFVLGMEFGIVEIEELSGNMAHAYSVMVDNSGHTLLDKFFEDNTFEI